MAIVIRWNPATDIFTLDDIMSHILEWTVDSLHARKREKSSAWTPTADMYETEKAIIIDIELAGIDKNSLEILFQDDYLFLRGNRPFSHQMQSAKIHRIERMYGHFQRVFQIPRPVDSQHISASYIQGVLKIILPNVNKPVPDQVSIPVTYNE
jgi:HSP20 family protein